MKKKINFITDRVIAILFKHKKLLTSLKHTLNLQSCAYFLLLEKGTTSGLTNPSIVIPLKSLYGEGQKKLVISQESKSKGFDFPCFNAPYNLCYPDEVHW